jgi:hypothetical protein
MRKVLFALVSLAALAAVPGEALALKRSTAVVGGAAGGYVGSHYHGRRHNVRHHARRHYR